VISSTDRQKAATRPHADCRFTLQELAEFAYARKIGGIGDDRFTDVASHLEDCEKCQKHLSVLYVTDPFLADQARPRLRFLEQRIAANQAMRHDDPEVGELVRQSLRDLLPNK
jgi:hypothetical protein